MTSEVNFVKTNEFLQRRKLRLQQVREQSKDIAKKIRQRAKAETLRQVKDVDAQKKKQYLECQKQFVDKLQEIYAKGLQDVGKGHENASEHLQQGVEKNIDKSKLRGKEAVAEVRRRKQEILDKKKGLLDRKLQAREAANEISREKSNVVAKTLLTAKESNLATDNKELDDTKIEDNLIEPVEKVDMGTQLNLNEPVNGYQTDIPELLLSENQSVRETTDIPEKLERTKRPNLFALSDEMPSSLRGGPVNTPEFQEMKSTVTLVSEYIQNRNLRLRETEAKLTKRQDEELQILKQTILRTRASKPKVNGINKDSTNALTDNTARKGSVTMYNHMTKDSRTLLSNDENLVIREQNSDDDAFTKAQKEETNDNLKQKELNDIIAERRNKVAVTKENVDKEYRDTLAFLNSLSKDMSDKPMRNAFLDEKRQQQLRDKREQKLRNEFRSLEKESRGQHKCKHMKCCQRSSKSPINKNEDSNDDSQYSWIPVPETAKKQSSIDVSVTNKQGNTVKFSNKNDYHEYRSNRKHSPPTKDIPNKRYVETAIIKEMGDDSTDCSSITSDSTTSDNFALNRKSNTEEILEKLDPKLSDADRIIIYKILNSKRDKKKKCHKSKSGKKVTSAQESVGQLASGDNETSKQRSDETDAAKSKTSFDQLIEGIYTAVNKNGDNLASLPLADRRSTDKDLQVECTHKCSCTKVHSQDVYTRNITSDGTTERPGYKCQCMRNSNHSEGQTIHYPSAATSTTSLRNGETVAPKNGYIKIIDDVCQESGKFYVGTTGYLKDEAYEVVIQLRKKDNPTVTDGKQGEKTKNQEEDSNKNITARNRNVTPQNSPSEQVDINENEISQVTRKQREDPTSPLSKATLSSKSIAEPISPKDSSKKSKITDTQDERTKVDNVLDNNNSTSCIDRKKATSTYTQTTSSPIHKPAFMHLSSTTSTAYMSPPEVIMPRFLKRDSDPSYDETYDSIKELQKSPSYNKYKRCECKHHILRRKKSSHSTNPIKNSNKFNYRVDDLTTNNMSSAGDLSDSCCKNYKTTTDSVHSKEHCTCSRSKTCNKHKKEVKSHKTCHHRKSMSLLRDGASKHAKNPKSNILKRKSKTHLNPMIKEYVNKLLELNKEGMKAIEIINEECSSVPTPSSSIINDNSNVNGKPLVDKKISLEQIKNILKEKIINDLKIKDTNDPAHIKQPNKQLNKNYKSHTKLHRPKQLHKVKSLYISKEISKANECKNTLQEIQSSKPNSTSSSFQNDTSDQAVRSVSKNSREKNSTPPRRISRRVPNQANAHDTKTASNSSVPVRRTSVINPPSDSEHISKNHRKDKLHVPPAHTSTQTSGIDCEDNLMKVAEGKLKNMEKIADLTEKCTNRLSHLAKVLEEVRRNKSLFYSQITSSDSTSDSEVERNKKNTIEKTLSPAIILSDIQDTVHKPSAPFEEKDNTFIPILTDIPKPIHFKSPLTQTISQTTISSKIESNHLNIDNSYNKSRPKPPPALSRIYLKNEQEYVIPHELSTVLEVDSPMSIKLKTQSRNDLNADDVSNTSNKSADHTDEKRVGRGASNITPPMSGLESLETGSLKGMKNASRKLIKTTDLTGDSSDNSKLQMMDMNQFNEIMLKPFISIQEFAKKKNVESIVDASNMDDNLKGVTTNDDISSLHSENSLPDVIAELLKRKVIDEPFKFDTASNVNTSTSESTTSLIALSNNTKERKKTNIQQGNKAITETSDTLSISSNPDLEKAFQKLGMGWASSTLKKTKERLALSSSSNTSTSSGAQPRGKIINVPPTHADYISALQHIIARKNGDTSKNVEQQTSLSNSMTVKEFLTNQLAKKITFTNRSSNDLTDKEFVSLYETKMPEEMKKIVEEDQSGNSGNCTINRARTSTPVQVFRSMTYHSTSSSNNSNGLFSNADDLSSVKITSNSIRNHSTSDKDDLTIPNYILKITKEQSDCSKSD